MLKLPAQENISTLPLKPLNLLKHHTQEKQILIFCTDSNRSFWMRKSQDDQDDWTEVLVNSHQCDRDGGSITFRFKEEEYSKLYISSPLYPETSYISGNSELKFKLKRIPLSIRNLEKIGITKQVELDLLNIPETTESEEITQRIKSKETDLSKRKNLLRLAQRDLSGFFDALSKDSEEVSEPGTSSAREKTKGFSQLKM